MDEFKNTLDQLKDSSGEMKSNLHILDEIIPIEEQMKYFKYSEYIHSKRGDDQNDYRYFIHKLFSPDIEIEDRRYYLTILAGIADVAAYRAIETYRQCPLEPELSNWSAMALVENKILLDAELSGEKQFFVSTGLGGQDGMLRFFTVIASSDRTDFSDFQIEMINKELMFAFDRNSIVLEEISVHGNYLTLMLLCDLKHDIRSIINDVISECNDLGYFIDPKFILTNLKKIKNSDIERMLNRKIES